MAVETFPAIPLSRVVGGLGVNLGGHSTEEWAYAMARAAGCTEVRFQIAWANFENFSSPGTYIYTHIDTALRLCRKYGLRPIVVAAYAPPWQVGYKTITVQGAHAVGSTTITTASDLTGVVPKHDCIGGLWYENYFNRASYYGAVIHAINGNQIQLGSTVKTLIPDGTAIRIQRPLYAPVPTSSGSYSADRYAAYVQALADRIDYHGIVGRVEIWNEPPWPNDFWDRLSRFYDDPAGMGIEVWTRELEPLVRALIQRQFPSRVGLVCGGSHKSGFHGLLSYLTPQQVADSAFVADAIHPYGTFPETHFWNAVGSGTNWGAGYVNLSGTSNMAYDKKLMADNPAAGLEMVISEYGSGWIGVDNEVARNYTLRHLVAAWAMGIQMVNLYSFAETAAYALVDPTTHEPTVSWDDIKEFMSFVRVVNATVDDYQLPVIQSWTEGAANLAVFTIGPLLVVYQRTDAPLASPTWVGPQRLVLSPGPGQLLVLGANDRGHQDAGTNSVYVGAKPVILTRYLG